MAGVKPAARSGLAVALLMLVLPQARCQQTAVRAPVPADADLARAETKLWEKHKAERDRAQADPAAGLPLAERLCDEARAPGSDGAARYVRLRAARDLAARAGDLVVALEAAEEMARSFVLDPWLVKVEAVGAAVAGVRTPDSARSVVEIGLRLVDQAVDEDHYDPAARLARLAEQAARRSRDLPLVLSVQKYQRGVKAAGEQHQRLRPFLDRLQKEPEDPDANRAVGRYLALLKGQWERGLFLLAQGNDAALRLLAQRDLAHPDSAAEQVELGDAWWQQASREKDQARLHLRQRAAFWYEQALAGADELLRPRLQERIAAVPRPRSRAPGWDYVGPPRPLLVLRGHTNAVFGVAFTPDGKRILSGSVSGQGIVWEAATGKQVHLLQGHSGMIWSVACGPKGRHLFTASWDGTVRLWDARTGKEKRRFPAEGRINDINGLAVSADGKRLLTGTDDGVVRLWDVASGREVRQMRGHNGFVYGVAFSPDGRQALSGGSNDGTMILWDVATGKELRRFQGLRGNIRTVAISPDGRRALSSGENDVVLWDLKTGQELRRFRGHTQPVHAVAFSPDGRRILSGGADGSVRLWDTASGRELHRYIGHSSAVFSVAFSPGGGRAVSGSQDATVRTWGLPR
jgi:hypothetical protein